MKIFFKLISIFLISISSVVANEVVVFEFTEAELSELTVRKVRGAKNETKYTVGKNENGNFLKAVADNAASGLGKEVKIDLNKTPFINITWKIEKDLSGIKEDTKKAMILQREFLLLKKQVQHHYQTEQLTMCFQAIEMLVLVHQVHTQKNL